MAYIYGSAAQSCTTRASARRKDILLRVALPLLFILILAGAGFYSFKQSLPWVSAIFAVFFVAAVLRFEELGLAISHYLSHSQANARTGQVVARALEQLPNEYHVFHDLNFTGGHLDHAVIGPSGFFPIMTGSHLGNVSASGESLRLNGWPFLLDMLSGSWSQTQKLTKHLGLHYSGDLHPCPVLCFSRASVGIAGLVRGALVVEAGNLVQAILTHEDGLPPDKILLLVEKLSEMVGAKDAQPQCTQDESLLSGALLNPAQPDPNLPVCSRCGHKATPGEFELFPRECPKCGRLYSFEPHEPEAAPGESPQKRVWKPSLAQLAVAVLLVAGGAGYLAYSQGLLTAWTPQPPASATGASQVTAPTKTDAQPMAPVETKTDAIPATAPDSLPDVNASQLAAAPTDTAQPGSVANATAPAVPAMAESLASANETVTQPPVPVAQSPAETPVTQETKPDVTALTATDAPDPKAAHQNATPPAATAKASTTKPADPFDRGKLVVTSAHPVTLWFKNQQTFKELGPYEVNGKKDILLPKGFYSVVYLENGKRRQTTMSFLSDFGQLDF
jgi:hypothetical protein